MGSSYAIARFLVDSPRPGLIVDPGNRLDLPLGVSSNHALILDYITIKARIYRAFIEIYFAL